MQSEFEQNLAFCFSLYGFKGVLERGFKDGEKDKLTGAITKKFPQDNLQVTCTNDQIIMVTEFHLKEARLKYQFIFNEHEVHLTYLMEGWNQDMHDGYTYSHHYSLVIRENQMVSARVHTKWNTCGQHLEQGGIANSTMQTIILDFVVSKIELLVPQKAIQGADKNCLIKSKSVSKHDGLFFNSSHTSKLTPLPSEPRPSHFFTDISLS